MFAQITAFLQSIPFFSSTVFGVTAMLIVGASWCLVGLVMGDAPKKGIEPSLIQLFGAAFSVSLGLVILFATQGFSQASFKITFWTCAAYAFNGASNFLMLQLMSKAMQTGPNGIIWAIIQSALIFPFLGGVIFFNVQSTIVRWIGIGLLILALIAFAMTKKNTTGGKSRWKLLAFICLAMCAIQQNVATAPSYFPEAQKVTSIVRSLAAAGGTLFTALVYNWVRLNPERKLQLRSNLGNLTLWKYIGALQFFNLLFAYTLFYPGMDVMANHGMGGMCYPMMVGSCIVSFTAASVLVLKEKINAMQIAALAICIGGLLCLMLG